MAREIPPLAELQKLYPGSMLLFDGTVESALSRIRSLPHEDVRRRVVESGLQVVKNFDAPIVAEKYYRLYKEVIS
ncbi:MAG: hypothetical protein NXY59_08155 [Aigarchaeota archaeon]|nr:hypothetical protein [Candidatus Pelearchaeum maunauluense]